MGGKDVGNLIARRVEDVRSLSLCVVEEPIHKRRY
jgi:hypothetical protein